MTHGFFPEEWVHLPWFNIRIKAKQSFKNTVQKNLIINGKVKRMFEEESLFLILFKRVNYF